MVTRLYDKAILTSLTFRGTIATTGFTIGDLAGWRLRRRRGRLGTDMQIFIQGMRDLLEPIITSLAVVFFPIGTLFTVCNLACDRRWLRRRGRLTGLGGSAGGRGQREVGLALLTALPGGIAGLAILY